MPSLLQLRARDLARRPVVLLGFGLQAAALAGAAVVAALGGPVPGGIGHDPVAVALRLAAVPGGLVFGGLVAAVVGGDITSALERALLARDPRRLRFIGWQLGTVLGLALAWWLAQGLAAVLVGLLARSVAQVDPLELWGWAAVGWGLASVLAIAVVYGLLGMACALVFRGGLAGVAALLAYGLLGEVALAPLWKPSARWTLYDEAGRMMAAAGPPPGQAVAALGGLALFALGASLAGYVGRQVRS